MHAEEAHISEKAALQERCKKLEELEAKVKSYEEAQRYFEARESELLQQVEDMRGRYENLKEGMQISAQNAETKAKVFLFCDHSCFCYFKSWISDYSEYI